MSTFFWPQEPFWNHVGGAPRAPSKHLENLRLPPAARPESSYILHFSYTFDEIPLYFIRFFRRAWSEATAPGQIPSSALAAPGWGDFVGLFLFF